MNEGMSPMIDPICFGVDARGVVVELSITWTKDPKFSADAPTFGANFVGTLLADHIAGQPTRDLVAKLIDAVKMSGKVLTLPYRCDTPCAKRVLEMRIAPRSTWGVTIGHRQIAEQPLPEALRFQTVCTPDNLRCSFCNRIEHDGSWVDTYKAQKLGLLSSTSNYPISYTVCGDCDGRAQTAIRRCA